jgi:hypothetical protein
LANLGRRAQAIDWFVQALESPALNHDDRATFEQNLATIRTARSEELRPMNQGDDWIDAIDAKLNQIIQFASVDSVADFLARESSITKAVLEIRMSWDRLGPSQRARTVLLEAMLAYHHSLVAEATRKVHEAIKIASDSGDQTMVDSVHTFAALFGLADVPDSAAQRPFHRAGMLMNRARARLVNNLSDATKADREQALVELLEAVEIANHERFDYAMVDDRQEWGALIERIYSSALLLACATNRADVVSDVLESIRSQGTPEPRQTTGTQDSPNGLIRTSFGYLPVKAPKIAYVRDNSSSAATGIRLRKFAENVAGKPTWWWSNQHLDNKLFWSLRSPDGTLSCGMEFTDDTTPGLTSLINRLLSEGPIDPDTHLLVDGSPKSRNDVLAKIAKLLLPEKLREALLANTLAGVTTSLVYAPGKGLAALPIALLPIGAGHCLLEAATITIAPPVGFISTGHPSPPTLAVRPVVVTLGTLDHVDPMTESLVGSAGLGLSPSAVFGDPGHVRVGVAGAIAEPETVLKSWRSNPDSIALYYGHIVPAGSAGPLSTAMQLSNSRGRIQRLEASRLLEATRQGGPDVVVLAGCSSATAADQGTGEWWGLTAGLLWQGTQFVVGSLWNLLHCQATVEFVVELVESLRTTQDPAGALRQTQLRWLRNWRSTPQSFATNETVFHPFVWAAFTITGSYGGTSS